MAMIFKSKSSPSLKNRYNANHIANERSTKETKIVARFKNPNFVLFLNHTRLVQYHIKQRSKKYGEIFDVMRQKFGFFQPHL